VERREGRDEIREGREEGRVRGMRRGGKGQRERGHEGAWALQRHQLLHPPCKNPRSATEFLSSLTIFYAN